MYFGNCTPIHFDHHYAQQTEFGRPLVDSTFTFALVTGQSVTDVSQNVFANLGWDEVRLPNPVFEGDTIYSQSEVLEKRESKSRPDVGIVKVKTTGFNQEGKVVISFRRTIMVYKKGHSPGFARPLPPGKFEGLVGKEMVNFAREDLCLHQLFERQVRRSPRAPETYELRDGNAYDDRNMRQALRGSGLRRPQINASLFGNYVRYFVNRGWVQASPGLPREIREGAQHGF